LSTRAERDYSNFLRQLTLTDRSVTIQRESSSALGQGYRLGFLGSLHMDVFRQRLEDEYDANIIVTAPTVPYKGLSSDHGNHIETNTLTVVYRDRTVIVSNPTDFPDIVETSSQVREVQEPIVKANIIVPEGLSAFFKTDSAIQIIYRISWRDDGPLLRAQSGGC
jgi:translation factor GUF1, mitochondrial